MRDLHQEGAHATEKGKDVLPIDPADDRILRK
jgi:hypothetical protein